MDLWFEILPPEAFSDTKIEHPTGDEPQQSIIHDLLPSGELQIDIQPVAMSLVECLKLAAIELKADLWLSRPRIKEALLNRKQQMRKPKYWHQ